MCERAKDEPLMHYWFRQFKEEPLRVLIFAALAALCYLYTENQERQDEYRADAKAANEALVLQLQASTQVMYEIKVQLETLNTRVGHLEREHEQARKQ
jgi:sensor domain CHASE-containing protein